MIYVAYDKEHILKAFSTFEQAELFTILNEGSKLPIYIQLVQLEEA